MTELDTNELYTVDGGTKCYGLWIGTYDGLYGVCIGYSE